MGVLAEIQAAKVSEAVHKALAGGHSIHDVMAQMAGRLAVDRHDAGKATGVDVLRAEVQLANERQLLLEAQNESKQTLLLVIMLTAFAVVREREIGTLEQIMVTPIRPAEFILGKPLPFFLIGLFDVAWEWMCCGRKWPRWLRWLRWRRWARSCAWRRFCASTRRWSRARSIRAVLPAARSG